MTSPRSSHALILVPTAMEADRLAVHLGGDAARLHVIGFGQIAAAATTAGLIARGRVEGVLLLGLAGQLGGGDRVGSAVTFDRVRCEGIGVGDQPAASIGWHQVDRQGLTIGDELPLVPAALPGASPAPGTLLSVCAASASRDEALRRRRAHPDATAEDMEAFGVAVACRIAGVPLTVIRGLCNEVGDRDHRRWQIEPALRAVASWVASIDAGSG